MSGVYMKSILVVAVLYVGGCAQAAYELGMASCAPVYGNWCGENYPTEGYDPRPVDSWDRACRAHDRCYESGASKKSCDREFLSDLQRLSQSRIAPQSMVNADSWFRDDGWFSGFQSASSAMWAASADCEGGDGVRAQFFCQTGVGACPLTSGSIPGGYPGYPCQCNGWPGRIGEM